MYHTTILLLYGNIILILFIDLLIFNENNGITDKIQITLILYNFIGIKFITPNHQMTTFFSSKF